MKILFFSYAYPNALQPELATFNRTMIEGLAADHDVRVVSPVSFKDAWLGTFRGKLPRGLNDPQFAAVPGVKADYVTSYYVPKLCREQFGRWMWWSVRRKLDRIMRDFRPDVVLSYWAHPDGEVAVRMAHQHSVPAVTMVGGSDVLVLGRSGARRQAILNVLHHADGIVTVSDQIAATLQSDGVDRSKIHVVRRGVDRTRFSPGDRIVARRNLGLPENDNILVAVGRLVPVKGFQHLIDAIALLKQRGCAARCYILGDGELREQLQSQIEQLGVQDVVELRGGIPQCDLAEWYRAADVTVSSSLSEGVPNVLLESIACGTPIVATGVGGTPEIVDPQHDLLVPPQDSVALADAIRNRLARLNRQLSPRMFEPLGLRAASRRLMQTIEQICAVPLAKRPDWSDFTESSPVSEPSAPSAAGNGLRPEAMNSTRLCAGARFEAEQFRTGGEVCPETPSEQLSPAGWAVSVSDGEGQFLEDLADVVDEVGEASNVVPDDDVFLPGDEDEDDELGRTAESFVLGSKS